MFGATGMLWFGAGISIPVLIHLFARQRYKRLPWAAMDFLQRAFKKTRKRIRLEHLLLLLLRMLAILLFVLALADPIIESSRFLGGPDARREVVIVVDTSFSMGSQGADGDTAFKRSRSQALTLLRALKQDRGDSVTLVTAGKPARPLIKRGEDLEKVRAELEALAQGDGATDFLGAFETVVAMLQDLPRGAEVFVFSDLQRVGFVPRGEEVTGGPTEGQVDKPQQILSSLVREMRARDATFNIVLPQSETSENVAVTSLVQRSRAVVSGVPTQVVATVMNFGTRAQGGIVHLYVDGRTEPVAEQALETIEPKKAAAVDFQYTFRTAGSHYLEVRFESDGLVTDNRRALAVEVREAIQTLVVEGDPGSEPGGNEAFFFPAALDPREGSRPSMFTVEVVQETQFERSDLGKTDLLVLMNVGLISRRRAQEIRDFVEQGGGLLIYLGNRTQPATMNALLYEGGSGVLPAEILDPIGDLSRTTGESAPYVISSPDYSNPALAYFNDPRLKTLLSLPPIYRFFKTRPKENDPDVSVLALFTRERADLARPEPAILEKRFGKGRTILITTTGDQDWTEMPVFPTYLLLNKMLAFHLTRRETRLENLSVGQRYERVLRSFARKVNVARDGELIHEQRPLALDNDRGYEIKTEPLERAGVYRLSLVGHDPKKSRDPNPLYLAVNVEPSESDLARVSREFLLAAFPGDGINLLEEVSESDDSGGRRNRTRAWWWMLLAAGTVLLLETGLSQIFGLRAQGVAA